MTDAWKPDVCIYHAPCQDGFTAAWAIWSRWPDVECVPAKYGDAPPDVTDKHVLIVDFSYPYETLRAMGLEAASVTVLDHHVTALMNLAPFDRELVEPGVLAVIARDSGAPAVQARFDMQQSGAMLAWIYAWGDTPAPRLVQHVQDRDLWRFQLPGTEELTAFLFSHDYTMATWSDLVAELEKGEARSRFLHAGAALVRRQRKLIHELLALTARPMIIAGRQVLVANMPYAFASEAGNILAQAHEIGGTYFDDNEGKRRFSLRAAMGGPDVSAMASLYGGGGHSTAAGFAMPHGWEGDAA